MKLSDFVSNYVFSKLTSIKEGATIDDVKTALEGLDSKLQGLSDDERVKLFEETPALKSHTDGRVSRALDKTKKELEEQFSTERQKYNKTIEELRAMSPEKDVETLKKEWLEASEKEKASKKQAYEYAKLKADLESMKKEAEEAKKSVQRNKLKDLAKSEFGDRKIPKFFNIEAYLGADEEETKEKAKIAVSEYDEFLKTLTAEKTGDKTPPDGDNNETDIASEMSKIGNF